MLLDSPTKALANELSGKVIGAAIEVHRELGPGLLESAYEACLCRELALRGIPFARQVPLPIVYKGEQVDCAYRLDVLVHDLVIVEAKSVDKPEAIHEAQLLTYLWLSGRWLGLLINFNVEVLKNGIRRLVNG
jgi:GxxExxY protein